MGFSKIPQPASGIDSFTQGINTARNFMDFLSQQRARESNINQQRTLLPHMLQQYQQQEELHPLYKQQLAAQIEQAAALAPYQRQHLQAQIQHARNQAAKEQAESKMLQELMSGAMSGQSAPTPASTQTPVANAPMPEAPQMAQPQGPQAGVQTPSPMPEQQPIQQEQPPPQGIPGLIGPEEIVKPASNPKMEMLDNMARAGAKIGTLQPKIDVRTPVDGIQYTYYPSGKVTRQKVAPSWEEKQQALIESNGAKEQKKADIKATEKIENETRSLEKSAHYLDRLNQLLQKDPRLTGIAAGLQTKFNLSSNPDLATFNEIAGRLQAEIGRYASQRGGIQAVKWAESVKPGISRQPGFNVGTIRSGLQGLLDDFMDNKAAWEAKNPGKEFPFKLPDVSNIVKTQGVMQQAPEQNEQQVKYMGGKKYTKVNGKWHHEG